MKIDTYLNFAGVLLLHEYNVGNPLLNQIVDNQIKPSSGLFIRPKTKFNRELMFY
jgi:hypothetical protein